MSARRKLTLPLFMFTVFTVCFAPTNSKRVGEIDINGYREKVRLMFYHAYEGYLTHAYPYDELQPLTCAGHDTWGSYSLTLIDAMDTLIVMGNYTEFKRIAQIIIDKGESFFDIDINVSVFETNIRIVGGLISAHLMMRRAGMVLEPAWPCSGSLLRMADNIARKILPAFDTATGMPYGTVNLRHGVPKGETTVTCAACIGTFIIEFGTLSRLTGDPIFEKTAIRAIRALWKYRSNLGLLGNHIDVSNGKWTAQDSGIGGGIDSYFEYLVKGAVMFNIPELLYMFREYEVAVKKYLKRDDWYMWAQMSKGTITLPLFTSLDGYWPSIKGMLGDIDEAMKTMHNFHQVWRQFGFTPEYYNIPKADVHGGREGYPLRPEIIESAMYLYQATKDPYLLEIGVDIVEAIEHSARTSCGYATFVNLTLSPRATFGQWQDIIKLAGDSTGYISCAYVPKVKDVRDHRLEDRMESFFLAETTKYLYLLFDPENFIHNNGSHGDIVSTPSGSCVIEAGGYIFNTEAHPIDLAAVHCCSAAKKEEDKLLQEFHDNLDLLSLLDLVDDNDKDWMEAEKKRKKKKKKIATLKGQDNKVVMSINDQAQEKKYEEDEDNTEVYDDDDASEDVLASADKDTKTTSDHLSFHEQKKKKHHLHVVDMASFTEAERNLTRIFMEELKMDSIMKNISAQIAEKLKQQYKETEYERLAIDTARKIFEAGDGNVADNTTGLTVSETENVQKNENLTIVHDKDNDDESEATANQEVDIKDKDNKISSNEHLKLAAKREMAETSSQENGQLDTVNKKQLELIQPSVKITITRSDGTQETLEELHKEANDQQMVILQVGNIKQENTVTSGKMSSTSLLSDDVVDPDTEVGSTTVERFKSHVELQLQHPNSQKQQQHQESSSSFLQTSPTSGPTSSLENKRSNILSLTAKILKLFSGDTANESKEGDDGDTWTPSLSNLYTSLANYPLTYFHDPSAMHCPAQPFHSRISVYGEMFPDD